MGGSGGGFFTDDDPKTLRDRIRQQEEKAKTQDFDLRVAEALENLLHDYNDRDVTGTRSALDDIERCLEQDLDGAVDLVFGGSVQKHTYVDGISDVDALVILKDRSLADRAPQGVLKYFEDRLRAVLGGEWHVSPHGQLAVTLTKGALELQLIPAVKVTDGIRIPSAVADRWSRVNPATFAKKLSSMNATLGTKLVPTIKLAKLINASYPAPQRLTGYHIESLGIAAFRDYAGTLNPKAMLEHFFDRARSLVLAPIRDSSGQSVHVDSYLGPQQSEERKARAANLDRTLRRMKNADGINSKDEWMAILGGE